MRNISPVVKDDDIEKKKHTHPVADQSTDGLMSATDKKKLDEMSSSNTADNKARADIVAVKSQLPFGVTGLFKI